jgi:hypothetical protein
LVKRVLLIGAGFLAAGCSGGSDGGVTSPATVTLADVQAQIFSPRCALSGCHVGAGAPKGLDLSAGQSAAHLVSVPSVELPSMSRVEPFDGSQSYLYLKLTADPQILGDPMPASGPALNAGQLDLIQTWIEQGAM